MLDDEYLKELDEYAKSLVDELEKEDVSVKLKKLTYSQLLDTYLKKHGKDLLDDYYDIVPAMFQLSDDYDKKNRILEDANNKGILLEESEFFPEIIEQIDLEKETIPSK